MRERWATLLAVGVGVVGMTVLGVAFAIRTGEPLWLFLSLPFTAVLFVVGRYAPTGYRLSAQGVEIERRAGPLLVPYRTIRGVDLEERPVGGVGLGASRGVFGRFGRFWNHALGVHRLYVTDSGRVVWLHTVDGWMGLSPERPQEFVDRLRAHLHLLR